MVTVSPASALVSLVVLAESTFVAIVRVFGPLKDAVPSNSVMLGVRSPRRYSLPPSEMGSIRSPKMRCCKPFQSTSVSLPSRLSRLRSLTSRATSAVYTNIFVGMQPTLMHVPPKMPFSTIAIFLFSLDSLGIELPEPVPTMMRSKCSADSEDPAEEADAEDAADAVSGDVMENLSWIEHCVIERIDLERQVKGLPGLGRAPVITENIRQPFLGGGKGTAAHRFGGEENIVQSVIAHHHIG